MSTYTIPFDQLDNSRVSEVGGKNASLGEMYKELTSEGLTIPDGFATTATAYKEFLEHNALHDTISEALSELDVEEFSNLKETGKKIRTAISEAEMPGDVAEAIREAYRDLESREEQLGSVAVRSSATAEDLPEASFAGQHDSFMNISGEEEVLKAVQRCIASLFTDRAIKYREDNGFDHMKVALSAGVQKMVRSDKACAGVAFSIDPDSGFGEVIFINGSWGLGDNVVGGVVNADQFYVSKTLLERDKHALIHKSVGTKKKTLVYAQNGGEATTENVETPEDRRNRFILSDDEVLKLGHWAMIIEKHYDMPMDIEWAKDGNSEELYIVQARPETVHAADEDEGTITEYSLVEKGKVIVKGNGIGDKIGAGRARILQSPDESDKLEEGDILVTEMTNPDWDPIMKKTSAIVTNSGGRTSHAAIVAREQGVVAVVGAKGATDAIEDGQEITVSSVDGSTGVVYEGKLDWDEEEVDLDKLGTPNTEVMLILSDPLSAFRYAQYPVKGVGLTRLEFAINNDIGIHPLALVHFDELEDEEVKEAIAKRTAPWESKEQFFVEKLAMAVGTIAAAFYPRDVIVRMSDFKSNEYANLLGGSQFEPEEENPMLGFRGASRYYSDEYREGFRLECQAMKRAIENMGLDNIILMVPFCRTPEEGRRVRETMEEFGIGSSDHGGDGATQVYVMVEIPANVIGAEAFADVFDGFSIGSNDLTQLTLGVDRDSAKVSDIFDERNDQVKEMIAMAIDKARKKNRKIGLCGQAPSDFPEIARFLVEQKIDSISFTPDAVASGIRNVVKAESE